MWLALDRYFAKHMGLKIERLVAATNENDILDRFWKTGYYEKKPVHGQEAKGGFVEDGVKAHEDGVRETYSPAMDILVSSFRASPVVPRIRCLWKWRSG